MEVPLRAAVIQLQLQTVENLKDVFTDILVEFFEVNESDVSTSVSSIY